MDITNINSTYSREATLQSQLDSIKSDIKEQKIKVMLNKDINSIEAKQDDKKLNELRERYLSLLGKLNSARSKNNKAARDVIFYNYSRKNPQFSRILNPSAYDRLNPEKSITKSQFEKKFEDFKDPNNEIAELIQKNDFTYRTVKIDVITY